MLTFVIELAVIYLAVCAAMAYVPSVTTYITGKMFEPGVKLVKQVDSLIKK